ncbi:MAG: hypothetical protein ACE5ED_01480 [Rhodothalassiaceae bacterium]
MTIDIREHAPGSPELRAFLDFPHQLYKGDPGWIRPLRVEARRQLDPRRNPFFQHAEARFFTAWRAGRIVGRCSAQVDHEHLRIHRDATGFFGFLDTIDDAAVCRRLIDAAGSWCALKGMQRMRGPFSLSINEEIGVMVEGFKAPSMILTPYHRPYQARLLAAAGLRPVKDILTWEHDCSEPPPRAMRAYRSIMALPEVTIRPIDKRHLAREMAIVCDIFNEAWQDNWGFVPWTDAELKKAVKDFELILIENLALVAEIDGEPVAIAICIPNLNEAIRDLDGRLGPYGLIKLLWRTKVRPPASAKLPLLGLRRSVRRHRRYAGLATALCVAIYHGLKEIRVERAELGWTLEDNHLVNSVIERIGAKPVKRHRIFERPLL